MNRYPEKFLLDLYRMMVRIRMCEESLIEPILKGTIRGPVHLYSGQEAIAAGVCAALDGNDRIFGTHRSHGHYLAKGGSVAKLIAEVYGKNTGCSRGRGGSMHLCYPERGMLGAAPIVAGTIALALGSALASRIRKDGNITVSFFGDGAAGEGVLYESLNFAALKKLPILFICENNFYSTHMRISECRTNDDIYKIGLPYGIESAKEDGNDVLKVYDAVHNAARKCRKGAGPALIEFTTYRLHGHVGPDDNVHGEHIDIRPVEEVESWKAKDPIKRFEKFLLEAGVMTAEKAAKIKKDAETETSRAHRFAEKSRYPQKEALERYVFKN